MMLWIIFGLMSAAAFFAVLWPLSRKPRFDGRGRDVAVYRDQLDEIERDRGAGLIGEPEAQAARIEVSRRLLAAADGETAPPPRQPAWHRRVATFATAIVVSLLPLGLYLALGSPGIPDQPAFARLKTPPDHASIVNLIGQVEQHLARNPNDGAGWEVIAPVYMRLGRFDDAVTAWRKALALNGETATRDSNLGEALVAAANGVVTVEAKQTFERALARDAHEPKAGYFLGLADEQDGNREAAAAKWRALLQNAPPGAPWAAFVREALARVSKEPAATPGPGAEDIAAAQNLPKDQRDAMIRGMVARLADRLHGNGNDVDGWIRLVRAYVVLGNRAEAKSAAADAKRALAGQPDAVKRIEDLVKGLGLEG